MKNLSSILIYTDGSCIGNPGPGGWAAVIRWSGRQTEQAGHENPTTNNRMEMTAVIRALEWVKKNKFANRAIELHSDSSLLIKTLNEGWKRKANLDLWEELDAARDSLTVRWFWVKGHAGHPLNERCDRLAIAQSEKAKKSAQKLVPTFAQIEHTEGEYACARCGQASDGKLSYMQKSGLIRVDCLHCGKYIKFAPRTLENLKRAKKSPKNIDEKYN